MKNGDHQGNDSKGHQARCHQHESRQSVHDREWYKPVR